MREFMRLVETMDIDLDEAKKPKVRPGAYDPEAIKAITDFMARARAVDAMTMPFDKNVAKPIHDEVAKMVDDLKADAARYEESEPTVYGESDIKEFVLEKVRERLAEPIWLPDAQAYLDDYHAAHPRVEASEELSYLDEQVGFASALGHRSDPMGPHFSNFIWRLKMFTLHLSWHYNVAEDLQRALATRLPLLLYYFSLVKP